MITQLFEDLIFNNTITAILVLLGIEEAGIPLPLPGDIILMYAGYQVAQGNISWFTAIFTSLIAVFVGSSCLYFVSYRWGEKLILRIGSYFRLSPQKLKEAEKFFNTYGILAIIFGRHIPGLRIYVTIFAGISKVAYKVYIIGTMISSFFWILIYLFIGELVGPDVRKLIHTHPPFLFFVIVLLLGFIIVYLYFIKWKRGQKRSR